MTKYSPWGAVVDTDPVAEGIEFVYTASHGGYYISEERLKQVPQRLQNWAARWAKGWGPQWYEEDCCAAAIPATFPDEFSTDSVVQAKIYLANFDWAIEQANTETITLPVQVNGKVRGNIEVAVDIAEEDLRGKVLAMENIQRFLPDSGEIRRFILVPGKIVNIVA